MAKFLIRKSFAFFLIQRFVVSYWEPFPILAISILTWKAIDNNLQSKEFHLVRAIDYIEEILRASIICFKTAPMLLIVGRIY